MIVGACKGIELIKGGPLIWKLKNELKIDLSKEFVIVHWQVGPIIYSQQGIFIAASDRVCSYTKQSSLKAQARLIEHKYVWGTCGFKLRWAQGGSRSTSQLGEWNESGWV